MPSFFKDYGITTPRPVPFSRPTVQHKNPLRVATTQPQSYEPTAPPLSTQSGVLSTVQQQITSRTQPTQAQPAQYKGLLYDTIPASAMTSTQRQYLTCMNVGRN